MTKTGCFFLAACWCGQAFAQINDGPYVLYKGQHTNRYTVEAGVTRTDSSSSPAFEVRPANAPPFTVQLHPIRIPPSVYPQPGRLLALSDVEGEISGFRRLLLANKVIDTAYRWTFGKGHLVICGDLFDRGEGVTEELWLLYRLEEQALRAGGRVHVLLGNHDLMNLSGDLRYVRPKYLQSAVRIQKPYTDLYGPDSELGRWLRSRNLIEKIGDGLYLHGGVSPEVNRLAWSIPAINEHCRPFFATPRHELPPDISLLLGSEGLSWFRGYFLKPRVDETVLDSTLRLFGVRHVLIGHTILKRNIALYYHGKLLALDVDTHLGNYQAVYWEKGRWWKTGLTGKLEKLRYMPLNEKFSDKDIQ